ncbi:hypothetical protein P3T76_015012 [Phytophthora citrophthora]|uniref:F-box domain-containing protein n=1 Tax=Phytophthora citrophthora TaxID=4793 RepID=A0AAD9FZY0_9STRA|nr:hypothetical protein P3T76_015012 [Phytophthora citrophthora]
MSPLLELPSELLELNVCQYLDVKGVSQLSLVSRRLQKDITSCSHLWETLVTRYFGYVNKPLMNQRSGRRNGSRETTGVRWRAVFAAVWRDLEALSPVTLQESGVLQVYNQKNYPLLLQPREVQIRQEIVLMKGLQRIPTSLKLIQLYAEVIRQTHLVPRMNAASTARALRTLAL